MDPITAALNLAAMGVQVGGGIIASLMQQGKEDEARRILERAYQQYGTLDVPDLTPIAAEVLGPSAFQNLQTDPGLREAQMSALSKMRSMEDGGGFNLEDEAALNRSLNASSQAASSQAAGLQEGFAARGIGGGGAEIAAQLANQQGGANRANQTGLDVAAQAQKRYFDSIREQAAMAGGVRGQDFNEGATKASAADEIARFNAGAKTDASKFNTSLEQWQYGQQKGLADSRYDMAKDRAAVVSGQGAQQAQQVGGTAQAAGQAMQAGANLYETNKPKQQGQSQQKLDEEKWKGFNV